MSFGNFLSLFVCLSCLTGLVLIGALTLLIIRRQSGKAQAQVGSIAQTTPSTNAQGLGPETPQSVPGRPTSAVPSVQTVPSVVRSAMPIATNSAIESPVLAEEPDRTELDYWGRLDAIAAEGSVQGLPLGETLRLLAQDLLAISQGNALPAIQDTLSGKTRHIKQYAEKEVSATISNELVVLQRDLHVITLKYLVKECDRLKSAVRKGKASVVTQRLRTSSQALVYSHQQHSAFHATLRAYDMPFPLAKVQNAGQSTVSATGTTSTLPSNVNHLIDALLAAPDDQVSSLGTQLIALGPAAFHFLFFRLNRGLGLTGTDLFEDSGATHLDRMMNAFNRVNESVPDCVLVEMFRNNVVMTRGQLREDLRPKISVWSEEVLRLHKEPAISELIALLQEDHVEVAARVLTINVLNDVRTSEGDRALLHIAASDTEASCRFLAVATFVEKATPAHVPGLVRGMQYELIQTSVDAFGEKMERLTSLAFSVAHGKSAFAVEALRQGLKFLNSQGPVDIDTQKFDQLRPMDRLQAFGYLYQQVLASIPELPGDELFQFGSGDDKDRRRFYFAWINPVLMASDDQTVRQKAVELAADATRSSDKLTSEIAKATITQASSREAQRVAQQLGLTTGGDSGTQTA